MCIIIITVIIKSQNHICFEYLSYDCVADLNLFFFSLDACHYYIFFLFKASLNVNDKCHFIHCSQLKKLWRLSHCFPYIDVIISIVWNKPLSYINTIHLKNIWTLRLISKKLLTELNGHLSTCQLNREHFITVS